MSAEAAAYSAANWAAKLEAAMSEVKAQIEQLCKRSDLCGELTEDNKHEWKECVDDIKEYLNQNISAAKEAIQALDADPPKKGWLEVDSVKDTNSVTLNCDKAGAPNETLEVDLKEIREEVAQAKMDLADAEAEKQSKCVDIAAELAEVCK